MQRASNHLIEENASGALVTPKTLVAVLLASFALFAGVSGAPAAIGIPDPSFGTAGMVFSDLGGNDYGSSTAYQADGKIVAAGNSDGAGTLDFALVRYNFDGTLDADFGSGGKVVTDFGQTRDQAIAVTIQSDGKIVAAGVAWGAHDNGYDFALARYLQDGTLDPSFGNGGRVRTSFQYGGFATAVGLQPSGKIVVGGSSWDGVSRYTFARYDLDGSLDTTFGTNGVARVDVGDGEARAMAVQTDGRIVAVGYSWSFFSPLVRLESDGSLDTGFGQNGVASGLVRDAWAVAIQPDGKIVEGGGTGAYLTLGRHLPGGSPDGSFGVDGLVVSNTEDTVDESAQEIVVQADGKLLVAGNWSKVLRYESDGGLDPTFGSGGLVRLQAGVRFWAAALSPESNRLALVGDYDNDFAVARIRTDFLDTPPVLTLPEDISAEATAPDGAVVTFEVSATDDVDPNPDVTCTPSSGALFGFGTTSVSCAATDDAGNTSTDGFSVTVTDPLLPFHGFFPPVDNEGVLNIVNAGRTIPVKFDLNGDRGLDIFAGGYPRSVVIDCSSGAQDVIEETGGEPETLHYDPTVNPPIGQYTYTWRTDRAWRGTCRQLQVTLNDGQLQTANFRFR